MKIMMRMEDNRSSGLSDYGNNYLSIWNYYKLLIICYYIVGLFRSTSPIDYVMRVSILFNNNCKLPNHFCEKFSAEKVS